MKRVSTVVFLTACLSVAGTASKAQASNKAEAPNAVEERVEALKEILLKVPAQAIREIGASNASTFRFNEKGIDFFSPSRDKAVLHVGSELLTPNFAVLPLTEGGGNLEERL